jgi:hypothetical protein
MHDILETMRAELDEGVALLRPHYPDDDDDALCDRAMYWRPWRYSRGRWPSVEEIEAKKAKEIEAERARLEAESAKLEAAE